MKLNHRSTFLSITAILLLNLSACNSSDETSSDETSSDETSGDEISSDETSSDAPESAPASAVSSSFNLADGPDVCFRAITKHLGADAKVSEITSFFSTGTEIDSSAEEPAGEMIICKVDYQNPDDPRKLLHINLDLDSGAFSEPSQVEITVTGGDAASFRLEDHLIPLAEIDAAGLTSVMNTLKTELDTVYSTHIWSGVRLEGPGAFSNTHTLRLDLEGRLAANDIKAGGYASITTDGKTVKKNHLMP